jgi:hypothetical protein
MELPRRADITHRIPKNSIDLRSSNRAWLSSQPWGSRRNASATDQNRGKVARVRADTWRSLAFQDVTFTVRDTMK